MQAPEWVAPAIARAEGLRFLFHNFFGETWAARPPVSRFFFVFMTLVDESDLEARDAKARGALERFRLVRVRDASGRDFNEAYAALEREFAPRGELERREVIAGWLGRAGYHLLVARDRDGRLAAVRDCHVI